MIELLNGWIFELLYGTKVKVKVTEVLSKQPEMPLRFEELKMDHKDCLYAFLNRQIDEDLLYFKPHGFDEKSLIRQLNNPAFLMMGVFDGANLIGYFFLRFFINGKCFVGRLLDKDFRGKGIGSIMNSIMYNIAWQLNFRCLSTISRNNTAVMRAHKHNINMIVLKNLKNDFLLVEFVKNSRAKKLQDK